MNSDYVNVRIRNQQKKSRLKGIVESLGANATTADIRKAAYENGFGAVNAAMLVRVRNELFPTRTKRNGGRPDGTKSEVIPNSISGSKGINRRRLNASMMTEKRCTKCSVVRPITDFRLKTGDEILRHSHCRECSRNHRAEYSSLNLNSTYGITESEYEEILHRQKGVCAICGKNDMPRNIKHRELCIDHCHTTGIVRGLLCSKCNLGIGHFFDDYELIMKAAEYIRGSENVG